MIYGVQRIVKFILGKDIAGRDLPVCADDTFVVSYPRSGNTWTRFLIANLLHPDEPATFANIERLVPDSEAQSCRYFKSIPRPRVIKSHQYFDPRFKKVIYIVRDPRDVALSYYDFQRKYRQIEDGYPLLQYVSDFVNGRLTSADWGTWGENVGSWVATRQNHAGFLLLRYEDMVADTERELTKIAAFLGIEPNRQLLANTIDRSSAERMRGLEKTQGSEWVSTKNKRSDIPFIRTASSGGWRNLLPADAIASIESAWGPLMTTLGYELVTGREGTRPTEEALQPSLRGNPVG
jgi:Sulfotransferase domain